MPPAPPPPPMMAPPAPAYTPTYNQFYDKYIYLYNAGALTQHESDRINVVAGVADVNGYAGNDHAMTLAWAEFLKLEQQMAE